ncbi:MAG: hypothetical protein EBZ59_13355 [Planctomycetia bacterium]|nr:hypothetical protein [Planctomycetia bacterium]
MPTMDRFSSDEKVTMDILGEILKQVIEGAAQQQAQQQRQPQPQPRQQPQQPPQGMPSPNDLGDILSQIFGGGSAQKLPEVVKQFEEKGMRDQVDSWVRTGPNKPVDRRQIEETFGQQQLDRYASSKGPKIIDELTPNGQLPARRG